MDEFKVYFDVLDEQNTSLSTSEESTNKFCLQLYLLFDLERHPRLLFDSVLC